MLSHQPDVAHTRPPAVEPTLHVGKREFDLRVLCEIIHARDMMIALALQIQSILQTFLESTGLDNERRGVQDQASVDQRK